NGTTWAIHSVITSLETHSSRIPTELLRIQWTRNWVAFPTAWVYIFTPSGSKISFDRLSTRGLFIRMCALPVVRSITDLKCLVAVKKSCPLPWLGRTLHTAGP